MKIGILLTGISSGIRDRDWKKTAASIKEKVINCWPGNNVSTYITTYEHDEVDELIEYYTPVKYQILDYSGSDQRLTYAKSLEMLIDQDLDTVISTRFDIEFYKKISEYSIDFNKFNFLFREGNHWWQNHLYTTDNLFIIPHKMIPITVDVVYGLYTNPYRNYPDLHPLYSRILPIIGTQSIHFLTEGLELSHDNTQYRLIRT